MEKRILQFLAVRAGVKAKDIASEFEMEKTEINSLLYSMKTAGKAVVTEDFRWSLAADALLAAPLVKEEPAKERQPTTEQKSVIEVASAAHIVVEAGPGTGKTETLANRLKYLVSTGGLSASQVLVLSFSVAAVQELRARIQRSKLDVPAAAYAEIRTFDSFASRLLRQLIPSKELGTLNYDQRIVRATEEMAKNPAAKKILGDIRHVLLDETQDLVGVRADFALRLLALLRPGFTVFADSAQGIYDFQLEEGPSKTTSADLLAGIRKQFPDTGNSLQLTKNFRVGGNERLDKIASKGRSLLLKSPVEARQFLLAEFASLPSQGETDSPQIDPALRSRSTCVVCRTNGQVLQIAGELNRKYIPFRIARGRNESVPPAWLGTVLLGWPESRVRRQPFTEKAMAVLRVPEPYAANLWSQLLAAVGQPKAIAFEMRELREALSDQTVLPDFSLFPVREKALELTTIHRSKGREYPDVIVVMRQESGAAKGKGEDTPSEVAEPRVLFVGLTRASRSVRRMEAKSDGERMASERWIRSYRQRNGLNSLSGIEVGLAGDVDIASFAIGLPEGVATRQAWLRSNLAPGTTVELAFDGRDGGCPRYRIMADGKDIGRMSSDFGWSLYYTLKNLNDRKPYAFPGKIENIWVRDIVTAVGDMSSEGVDRSLLHSGLWLVPSLEGLGKCVWS
jgi:DNA helicase-2/ATP-dependent DNA helicase PcrA